MKIQNKNSTSWLSLNLFDTGSFILGITFHNLKYLDKLIKCLEMRAKIRSVRKINEIFLCIFIYIWKLEIFSTYLNFDEKWFFGYFKSQISKPNTLRYILNIEICLLVKYIYLSNENHKIHFEKITLYIWKC